MLTGIEKSNPDMVDEHYDSILDGINGISMAAGELAIATHTGDDEDGDDPRFHTGDHDEDEFVDDEAEVAYTSSSRMVDLDLSVDASAPGIDQSILEAFERGAHMHVERSLENLTQDMDEAAMATLELMEELVPTKANVNGTVLRNSAEVANTSRDVFICAANLQVALTEHAAEFGTFAKQIFYRKTFSRAKGIINEVRDVADAVTSLSSTCNSAAEGNEGCEEVMAHASNVRQTIARLISGAETKLDQGTMEHKQLSASLRDACSEVVRASKQLTQACQVYNTSSEASTRRQSSVGGGDRRSSTLAQGRSFSSPRTSRKDIGLSTPTRNSMQNADGGQGQAPMSDVRRRTMLLEQQADVFRLERQLAEAQKGVRNLHGVGYVDSEGTTDI
jgi:hypothetical protein